jgi:hypothetical protein
MIPNMQAAVQLKRRCASPPWRLRSLLRLSLHLFLPSAPPVTGSCPLQQCINHEDKQIEIKICRSVLAAVSLTAIASAITSASVIAFGSAFCLQHCQ